MKFCNTQVFNFEGAFRGMRNPKNSWQRSDSDFSNPSMPILGENDLKLAQTLIAAGSEHRKFMRQIFVSVDITAPSYWIHELDTYKIGTSRNSCSFQHKGISSPFSIRDFSFDDERIYEVLDPQRPKREYPLTVPYETDEYKIYKINDREIEVYRNGRLFTRPFVCYDKMGRARHFEKKEVVYSQNPHGYFYCNLGGRNGERWLVHRLVAELWCPKEDETFEVNHKDGNKGNNSVENLEWVSHQQNNIHKFQNGLDGTDLHTCYLRYKSVSKVNPIQIKKMKEMYAQGLSAQKVGEAFGLNQSQISCIMRDDYESPNHDLFEYCWYWEQFINALNTLRLKYLDTNDYSYFRQIRQMLPMGYNYKFTYACNYEVLCNMVKQRENHSLTEWSVDFISWVETLPYAKELILYKKEN